MVTTTLTTSCLPRYGTKRSPERSTLGPAVGMVAAMLGKPLMEWQQHVADVVLEIDPDTGRLVYDEFVLTVPRQSGKSTFILAKSTHRASATKFFGPRQRIVYTAQTRQKAREKWEEDYAADLEASRRLKSKITVHKGNGNEHIRFANGSRFGIEANTEKAGHGGTLDEAYVDEAFAQTDNRLEQAFGPAMITRRNKQLGVISTAGWSDASPYLLEKVKLGRELVRQDIRCGTAFFEWAAPEDADPGLVETWLSCMPALHRPECPADCDRHTVTVQAIQAEYDKAVRSGKLSDFRRAYLNQWVPKPMDVEFGAFGTADWPALAVEGEPGPPLAIGLAVSVDRTLASIGAATRNGEKVHLGAVERRLGTAWIVDRAKELQEKYGCQVVIDGVGPTAPLEDALREAGVDLTTAKSSDVFDACGDLYDRVQDGRVSHGAYPELDEAVAGAVQRPVGDRWAWGRRKSASDVSMLEAVTLAASFAMKPLNIPQIHAWLDEEDAE